MVDFILSFSREKALGNSFSQCSCSSDYALVMRACVSHDQRMKTDEEEASFDKIKSYLAPLAPRHRGIN